MTPRDILYEVAIKHRIHPDEITGKRRFHYIVRARIEAYQRCRRELGMSYPALGRFFNRDHSTVVKMLKVHGV